MLVNLSFFSSQHHWCTHVINDRPQLFTLARRAHNCPKNFSSHPRIPLINDAGAVRLSVNKSQTIERVKDFGQLLGAAPSSNIKHWVVMFYWNVYTSLYVLSVCTQVDIPLVFVRLQVHTVAVCMTVHFSTRLGLLADSLLYSNNPLQLLYSRAKAVHTCASLVLHWSLISWKFKLRSY